MSEQTRLRDGYGGSEFDYSRVDTALSYVLLGGVVVVAVPLLIAAAPVWIPLAAIGFLANRAMEWWETR